jgi:hypothetical protein
MRNALIFILLFCTTNSSYAFDATNSVTEISQSAHWRVIEFAATAQLIYRLSSTSINDARQVIVFDFVPAKDCVPTPAVMVSSLKSYNNNFDEGMLPLAYKLPNQEQSMEMVKTVMSKGDTFAFFSFEQLKAPKLLNAKDRGKLAIWIPASGDGTVKRSGNIYFSLEGFSPAYLGAKRLCDDSK